MTIKTNDEIVKELDKRLENLDTSSFHSSTDFKNAVLRECTTAFEAKDKEREKAVELLKIARCPDSNCDNSGTGVDGYGEPYQCQWCYERLQALTPTKTDMQPNITSDKTDV